MTNKTDNKSSEKPTPNKGQTPEERMKGLSSRFRLVPPTGGGFIIGGVNPPQVKAEEKAALPDGEPAEGKADE